MARNHEPGTVLEVKAGPHDRKNAFVAFECGGGCDCQTGHTLYELDESGNRGAIVPCQCLTDCGCEDECEGGCSEMVWMVPELKAGQTKRYVMDKAAAGAGDDDHPHPGQLDLPQDTHVPHGEASMKHEGRLEPQRQ